MFLLQDVVTPGTQYFKPDAGEPTTSSHVYGIDCEGPGIRHIMKSLNMHALISSSVFPTSL